MYKHEVRCPNCQKKMIVETGSETVIIQSKEQFLTGEKNDNSKGMEKETSFLLEREES